MSFDPRTPYEAHFIEAKSGDQMVECFATDTEMEERARQLIALGIAKAGSLQLYYVSRQRVGMGARG